MERCRFCNCIKSREFCENIFVNKQTNPTIPTIVELFTNLKIVEDDPYTKFICFNCFHILIVFYHYREKVLETNQLLQNEILNTNQNVEDFHKKWPRIEQNDGQFVVYNHNFDGDCNTNLQIGSDSKNVENQCLSSLIGDDKKITNNNNYELCLIIKNEFDDNEGQTIDKNNQNSTTSIDNDYETTVIDDNKKNSDDDDNDKDNQQLDKNSLYTAESLGFIKNEIDFGEIRVKVENDFDDDDKIIINDYQFSDNKDSDRYCSVFIKDELSIEEYPSINVAASNRSTDNRKRKGNSDNNKKNSVKDNMIVLNEQYTEKKRYQCNICDKIFSTKSNLGKHLLIHTKKERYQCHICHKNISSSKYLARHLSVHTLEKTYQCNICNKKFRYQGGLRKHLHIHTDDRPYQCDICNKGFKQKSTLKRHFLYHTGEKPYQCGICNNRFSQKAHLKEHIRIHTGETPYQCDSCNKKFKYKKSLKIHLLLKHTDKKPSSVYKL